MSRDFAGGGVVAFFGLGCDGDFAGRTAAFPFELNFYGASGIAALEFDIGVENLLAVFYFMNLASDCSGSPG